MSWGAPPTLGSEAVLRELCALKMRDEAEVTTMKVRMSMKGSVRSTASVQT